MYQGTRVAELLLPLDPRCWTRDHVTQWLHHSTTQYQLDTVHPDRFPMNGKALLLMSKDMFLYRVPEGGGILYEDVQLKLQRVMREALRLAALQAGNAPVTV